MRTGFVGASIFATGLISLIADGGQAAGATIALAAMAIGGAIAWLSWRSVALLLRRIDEIESAAAAVPPVTGRAPAARCSTPALVAR
jgi:hypothetical protein